MQITKIFRNAIMSVFLFVSIITFAVVGMNSNVIDQVSPSNVVVADGRKVTMPEFKKAFEDGLKRMEEQGQTMTTEEAVTNGLDAQLLQSLGSDRSMLAMMDRLGVRPGLDLVGDRMKEQTAFFDPVTGQFDPVTYRQLLADNGLTESQFERELSDNIARQHLLSAIGAGLKPPRAYAALEAIRASQQRDVSYFWLTEASVAPIPNPTDAQLTAFIQAEGVRTPERRAMTVVRFSTAKAMQTATADPAQVERLVAFHTEEQTQPETRTVIQITARDQATAQTISTRLSRGEDPQAVATATHATLVRHDAKPKTALPDRKVADAAFALPNGGVSGPVQGDLGIAVVKVTQINPGAAPDVARLRAEAESEAKRMAASAKVSDMSDQLSDAVNGGEELIAVAQRLGAEVVRIPAAGANGMTAEGKVPPGLTPPIAQLAFASSAGEVSDVGQEAEGEFFVVRVDKIEPPAAPPLETIRAELTVNWRLAELVKRLEAKSTEVAGAIRGGQAVEAAAASAHAQVQRVAGLNQNNAQQLSASVPNALLSSAMGANKGQVFSAMSPVAPTSPTSRPVPRMFVARLDDVRAPEVAAAAQLAQRAEQGVVQLLQEQLGDILANAARAIIKPDFHPDRARRALGVDAEPAEAAPKADAKAAEK